MLVVDISQWPLEKVASARDGCNIYERHLFARYKQFRRSVTLLGGILAAAHACWRWLDRLKSLTNARLADCARGR